MTEAFIAQLEHQRMLVDPSDDSRCKNRHKRIRGVLLSKISRRKRDFGMVEDTFSK